LKDIGKEAASHLQSALSFLEQHLRSLNPLELLATAAFFTLHKPLAPDTDLTSDGPYPQAAVELLQTIALTIPVSDFEGRHTSHIDLAQALGAAQTALIAATSVGFEALVDFPHGDRVQEMTRQAAKAYTSGIRNWGYPQHMRRIIGGLFEPLESELVSRIGCRTVQLRGLFDAIAIATNKKLFAVLDSFRAIYSLRSIEEIADSLESNRWATPAEVTGLRKTAVESRLSLKQVRLLALECMHEQLADCYSFSLESLCNLTEGAVDVEQVKKLFERLSMSLGELSGRPANDLIVMSPICQRPCIVLPDGKYFIPIPGLLNSFSLEIIESFFATDEKLKARYAKRRTKYLEETIVSEMKQALPQATIEPNLEWLEASSGKWFEVDCVIVAGPIAIVLEAKSQRVTPPARRGAGKRLKRDFQETVGASSEQAFRTAKMLEHANETAVFRKKGGGEVKISVKGVRRVVTVSVLLDYLPAFTLCSKERVRAGLVDVDSPPSIAMSLSELFVVLEVLGGPAHVIHYFWRRHEIEEQVSYMGDEEDLLVFYLGNGFGQLLRAQQEANAVISLGDASYQLRRYFMAIWLQPHSNVARPRRILTRWLESVVRRVQGLPRPDKWALICCLLDLSYEEQKEFETRFGGLMLRAKRPRKRSRLDYVMVEPFPTESSAAVGAFVFDDRVSDQRIGQVGSILNATYENSRVRSVVIFAKHVVDSGRPYDSLYFSETDRATEVASF